MHATRPGLERPASHAAGLRPADRAIGPAVGADLFAEAAIGVAWPGDEVQGQAVNGGGLVCQGAVRHQHRQLGHRRPPTRPAPTGRTTSRPANASPGGLTPGSVKLPARAARALSRSMAKPSEGWTQRQPERAHVSGRRLHFGRGHLIFLSGWLSRPARSSTTALTTERATLRTSS